MNGKLAKLMVLGVMALGLAIPAVQAYGSGGGDCKKACPFSKAKDAQMGLDEKFLYKAHFALEHAGELGLSEQQKEDIKRLKLDTKKGLIRQQAEIDVLALDIEQQIRGTPMDTKAVHGLIDQKYELKKTKAKSAVEAIAKLKQVLSEDQHKKLKELFTSGKGHAGKR